MTRKASSQSPRVSSSTGGVGGIGALEDDLAGENVDTLEINGFIKADGVEGGRG